MDLHKIVTSLYNDRRVNEFINRLQPADLRDDLKQHCFLEIYRMEERHPGKVSALHQANQLWAWFHGLVRMQLTSEKTTFYRLFRRTMAGEDAIDFNRPEWPDMDLEKNKVTVKLQIVDENTLTLGQ